MADLIALMDLDGTLADYDGALQREMAKIASPGEPEFRSFMDADRPAWLEARRHLISSIPGFWRNLAPLEAGMEIKAELEACGFCINVLTKGPSTKPDAWKEKFEWCRAHIPDAGVSITEDKSLSYGRVLVDDWPPYFVGWLCFRPRGLVVVPAQPWNVDAERMAPANIFRYDRTQPGARERLRRVVRAAAARRDGEVFDVRAILDTRPTEAEIVERATSQPG